ncbi:MAG: ribonuclease HII [Candidatus Thermoplasmatota archaeon]|jgi:ribonuclease HII|nr:ribonuclease HII [Candidatus Thermoplasmatota archaeon]MCL5794720.1 ribonuclease HII [Candidatus Thermoplasmatota archaeon]
MFISIVCCNASEMIDIGVRDSKKLSVARRRELYGEIVKRSVLLKTVRIDPQELNTLMNSHTLNQIELMKASDLIRNAIYPVYVDSFDVEPDRLESNLSRSTSQPVHCAHKADDTYPSVAAASIVSKHLRDTAVAQLSTRYGEIGSGYPSDPRTVSFLAEAFRRGDDLSQIARTHWETYIRIRKAVSSSKLSDFSRES